MNITPFKSAILAISFIGLLASCGKPMRVKQNANASSTRGPDVPTPPEPPKCLTDSFNSIANYATDITAPPQIDTSDSHRFTIAGKPWFPVGLYGTALNGLRGNNGGYSQGQQLNYYKELIDRLSANNLNISRTWLSFAIRSSIEGVDGWLYHSIHPYERSATSGAYDGGNKFDLTKINPVWLTLIRDAVEYARTKKVVLQMMPLDCWHVGRFNSSYPNDDYYNSKNNINRINVTSGDVWTTPNASTNPAWPYQKALIESVVDAVGHQPNIIWETCNENFNNAEFHQGVASVIKNRESQKSFSKHLVMPVDLPEHRTVAGHKFPAPSGSETPIDSVHSKMVTQYGQINQPLISDNDCCDGNWPADKARQKVWTTLVSGGYTDFFNTEINLVSVLRSSNLQDTMRWLGYARNFVEDVTLGVDLRGATPNDSLASSGWVLTKQNKQFIIYLPNGGSTSISSLPIQFEAYWFNPRSGAKQVATGGPNFSAPGSSDWVLFIKETSTNPQPSPSPCP